MQGLDKQLCRKPEHVCASVVAVFPLFEDVRFLEEASALLSLNRAACNPRLLISCSPSPLTSFFDDNGMLELRLLGIHTRFG